MFCALFILRLCVRPSMRYSAGKSTNLLFLLKTQCKIRVNLGFREFCKGEITVLHREEKNFAKRLKRVLLHVTFFQQF